MAKVLLVEDDPFLSSLLKTRLEKEGLEVRLVNDGKEAHKVLLEGKFQPEVMLLDLILPGESGFEVLEDIRKTPGLQKIKALVLSNLGQEVDVRHARELGAEYLVKAQASQEDIVNKIKEMIK
ncbi:MAG: response regulator [Candidatus Harrisonbacteria bacterium]|nr:response regulator [Candidatus Harrisonbacteria bacterium]